jgi:hypothetical protein
LEVTTSKDPARVKLAAVRHANKRWEARNITQRDRRTWALCDSLGNYRITQSSRQRGAFLHTTTLRMINGDRPIDLWAWRAWGRSVWVRVYKIKSSKGNPSKGNPG